NLGLIFSNNFFVADTTLLVEGPSDEIYIASLLRTCDRLGVLDVDLNLFSIAAAGNSGNMIAMAKLMSEEGRRDVALVDGDGTGATIKKRLEAVGKASKEAKIDVVSLQKNKSIEDLVLYPKLLREAIIGAADELVSDGIRKYKDKDREKLADR